MQAVLVGNFDGVHRGHQALIRAARERVGRAGRVVAFTLEPHPAVVLGRPALPRLTPLDERLERLLEAGADHALRLEVNRGFLEQSPADFLGALHATHPFASLIIGPDFRFGKGQAGDGDRAREIGRALGFGVDQQPSFVLNSDKYGSIEPRSSKIKEDLAAGRLERAALALGRPFGLRASVIPGAREARTLGFPTANLDCQGRCLPPEGVYIGRGRVMGQGGEGPQWHPVAIHHGPRPSHSGLGASVEAVFLHPSGVPLQPPEIPPVGEYGWRAEIEFASFKRPIEKFSDLASLIAAIGDDARAAGTAWSATAATGS